ncbi:MAG: DUF6084 family protein [Chloroflexota bacterium]|nr:DUF6084 family protein [Chloroflexota bacterium]
MPDLDFRIETAGVLEYAAAPTLRFGLRIENSSGEPVRSATLACQIRIATTWRQYTAGEQDRLVELFGTPGRWADTLKSLLWTHTTSIVPPFTGSILVDLPVPCTYDFDVASAKYFSALEEGDVPLEFLFSGTVFYADGARLQAAKISWEKEARYPFPVAVWRQMMAHYFPNSAWLRLDRRTFDELYAYKARHGLPTWEAAVQGLLRASAMSEPERAGASHPMSAPR